MIETNKKTLITLIVPTHNRHHYLTRLLDYYNGQGIALMIADSSSLIYDAAFPKNVVVDYHHLPKLSLPAKIEWCLQKVTTPFVAMCADDDFTLPQGLVKCIEFLEQHPKVAAAQCNMLIYRKENAKKDAVRFSTFYKNLSHLTIDAQALLDRIEMLLNEYKSFFYAVHYTANLRSAFDGASAPIQNLYLNEYLTVLPLIKGYYVEFPGLFQVREHASDSDDKQTINIDKLISDKKYSRDVEAFLNYMAEKIAPTVTEPLQTVKQKLHDLFIIFAQTIIKNNKPSLKKRVGNILAKIPVIGNKLIAINRKLEPSAEEDLSTIVRTGEEKAELMRIQSIILKHKAALLR